MTIKSTVLSLATLGAAIAAVVLAYGADLDPVHVTNLTGGLRIQQGIPCGDDVDLTTPVTAGKLELTPSDGVDLTGGGKYFVMTHANLTFQGFSVSRSCLGFSRTRTYTDIEVQITRTIPITASPTSNPGEYAFTVPKSSVQIVYTTTVNGDPESAVKSPSEDVTGTINLADRTMSLRVVTKTSIEFKAGCTPLGCIIDETKSGTQTATIAGTLTFPDIDGDGVPDRTDNCRLVANPDQTPVPTPTITAPADVTVPSCLSKDFGTATGADVCDGAAIGISNNAPDVLSSGANVITWRAQDVRGRSATANQTVTVVDTTLPVFTFVPADLSLNNCGPVNLGTATATDDCAAPVVTNNAPAYFYVGTTPVIWTATDGSGNAVTATQKVTVTDLTPPILSCVATNPTGSSYIVSAIDACDGTVAIRFGSYVLREGETIMINETGQAGVRLVNNISNDGLRHFQVGKGEAIISATDAAGNSASLACPVR